MVTLRPRLSGANIRTWIGFKQILALVEESVIEWCRQNGAGPQQLFHEHGLELELLDVSAQLMALVEIDDQIAAEVTQKGQRLVVVLSRAGTMCARANVVLALFRRRDAPPPPAALQPFVSVEPGPPQPEQEPKAVFEWVWRARYFHCHYSTVLQHSAWVGALEETVERFLEARGLSIRRMLDERSWIPVVSRVRVQLLQPTNMGEDVYTNFQVTDILKGLAYDGRMDGYVKRGDAWVHVATANILHGYAHAAGESAGRLATLDEDTCRRLLATLP